MWDIRRIIKKGDYLYAVVPEHPKAIKFGYVLLHRVIMENYLGRLLEDDEVVHHCDFNKLNSCKCSEYKFREWLNSEYVEPPVDWSKVAVDTPILVKDVKSGEWNRGYFAMYENGTVFTWYHGATSWSAEGESDIASWKFAKLAESEE